MRRDDFYPGAWKDEPCFVIGGGPSVVVHDLRQLEGQRVIAINRALELIRPDIWTWLDERVWTWAKDGTLPELWAAMCRFYDRGLKVTRALPDHVSIYPGDVIEVPYDTEPLLGESFEHMHAANNSGFWALNMAYLLGANPIILIGYDCGPGEVIENWHDRWPKMTRGNAVRGFADYFRNAAEQLKARNVMVLNASPLTALDCWPVIHSLDDVLKGVLQ